MNLGEALAIKAKEQGIKNFATKPHRKPKGKPTTVSNEDILKAWNEGYSRYSIAKHVCKISITRVRKVVEEYENGKATV